jgi:hypothetical protein
MDERQIITRRRALGAVSGLFSVSVLGCRETSSPKPEGDEVFREEMPVATDPAPTLGWETIASGKYGPGVRSRYGLVYDLGTNAAVLFGGVV